MRVSYAGLEKALGSGYMKVIIVILVIIVMIVTIVIIAIIVH